MNAFTDKIVLVTGASGGIGRQLALDLSAAGARVALAARRPEPLEATAAACHDALAIPTDVADPDACRAAVARTIDHFGRLDALVNNAGVTMRARFDELEDLSILERLMRVNYFGAVWCTHAALPHLKESRGLLVAISSLTGKTGVPTRTGYAASKHAVQGFFDSLRVELRHTGVDVLVVSPGFVDTDIRDHALGATADAPAQPSMSVATCSRQILAAMAARRRELVMTRKARLGQWIKLLAPALVDRAAARATGDPGR